MKDARSPRVLVLEDDPLQLKSMGAALRKLEIDSRGEASSAGFMKALAEENAFVFLVDLNVERPGAGFEVIRTIRETRRGPAVIIAVSGQDDPESIARALEIGADDFLVKPVDVQLLAHKLNAYVQLAMFDFFQSPATANIGSRNPAQLSFDIEVESIDELGIRFLSPYLMLKGREYAFSGNLWSEIFGLPKISLHVRSTEIPEGRPDRYRVFAEFTNESEEMSFMLRAWLKRQAVNIREAGSSV